MPIHEFTCRDCGHAFEELLFGGEQAVCPQCASRALDKQLSVFAVNTPGGGSAGGSACDADFDAPPPGCGTCGDPRGPGACSMN